MYITLSQKKAYFITVLLAIILYVFSHSSLAAVNCTSVMGDNKTYLKTMIEKTIDISTDTLKPGTLIWESPEIHITLTCYDFNVNTEMGRVFINFNPSNVVSNINPSLEVYVKYLNTERPARQNNALLVNQLHNCTQTTCYPETININFSIVIRTTSQTPPADGEINSNGEYALFNVGAKNSNYSSSPSPFHFYLGGLSNIHFVSCKPQINVVANNGNTLDFGPVQSHNAQAGKTEKQIQFSVVANLTNAGQGCEGKAMNVSFSTTNPTNGGDMILPSNDSGFGFSVSPANDQNRFIPLNTPVALGTVNGSVASNNFYASLRWLNNSPKIGASSASANVDVTFK